MNRFWKIRPAIAPAALLVSILAFGPAMAGPGPVAAYGGSADAGSSMWYQQVLEHAGDPNTFEAGDAVVVPYKPRHGDRTLVGGKLPVALPAGRASGRSMNASLDGSTWATPDAPAVTAFDSPSTADAEQRVNVLRRQVYGYIPYWESAYASSLNFDILSTVAYFGVAVRGNGDLAKSTNGQTTTEWAGWNSSWMTSLINSAHAHGTRVALSVEQFAWTAGGADAQEMLLSNQANRANAVAQIVAAVRDRGADGVSLDFEPIVSTQSANFVTFVRELRTALDAVHTGYELIYCATGSIGYYDHARLTAAGAADAVWIMGYDFRAGGSYYAGSIDPLTSPADVYDLTQVINSYKSRVPVSKIILGLPWYGIAWSTHVDAPNDRVLKNSGCEPTSVLFAQAALLASQHGRRYDSIEESAWTAYQLDCGDEGPDGLPMMTWRELYYDDAQSLAVKYDRINYWNLRGMGIWALGYDYGHPEIAATVASRFLTDKTPPVTGIVKMPATQASEGFAVSWTGRDDWNGVARYDVQVSVDGGPFGDWLVGTTLTTENYQGADGHSYAFRVRGTDGAGNVGPWDVTSTYASHPDYAVGGFMEANAALAERASASSSATSIQTAAAGSILQIIGGPTVDGSGVTWYQVTGPFHELGSVDPLFPGLWVAATDGTNVWASPVTPPNSTAVVAAGIADYTLGTPGMLPSGTGLDRGRVFSPDGDGIRDTLPLAWTNKVAMDSVTLTVYAEDGSVAATVDLGAQAAGPQTYTWDGKAGESALADGRYLLALTGTAGSSTYYGPARGPFDAYQMTKLGAIIDTTPSGTYYPVAPYRLLDTRSSIGLAGAFSAGKARSLQVAGKGPVPANAMAVTGNLTVTGATVNGFVRFGSSVATTSSTLNFPRGDNRANGVTLGLDSSGALNALYVSSTGAGSLHLIFDVTGYFVAGAGGATFLPVTPTRIVDTRSAKGMSAPLAARKVATFNVAGLAGVPADAVAVTGNATVTGASGGGYVTVAPTIPSGAAPSTSTLNFPKGDTRANNLTAQLSGGKLQAEYWGPAGTSVQFVFDVTGYFVPGLSGATFVPVAPGRVVDSRTANGFAGPIKSGGSATFPVVGLASIKQTAVAVVGNLTCTSQTSYGWLAIGPGRTTTTSTLNFPKGDNRANGFVSLLGTAGKLTVTYSNTGGSTQAIVDILGYYR